MDINDNSIIGVYGDSANEFIHSLVGNRMIEGDVVLDYISMKADFEEYVKKVRLLTSTQRKQLNGKNLRVSDYFKLIQVLDDVYEPIDNNFIFALHLNDIENIILCDLDENVKLKIEFMASLLKKPKLIIIEDFFEILNHNVKKEIYECLKNYINNGNICLISSKDILTLNEFTEQIYYLNENNIFDKLTDSEKQSTCQ